MVLESFCCSSISSNKVHTPVSEGTQHQGSPRTTINKHSCYGFIGPRVKAEMRTRVVSYCYVLLYVCYAMPSLEENTGWMYEAGPLLIGGQRRER